jgi:hypothetical protein
MVYMPILKGRTAEFLALLHAAPPVTAVARPLLEVISDERMSVHGSVLTFGDRLMEAAPKGMIFAVDCRYLRRAGSGPGGDDSLSLVARDVHDRGIVMVPVFSLAQGQDLGSVQAAAALHNAGGCLRLDGERGLRPIAASSGHRVSEVLDAAGLQAADVDVVIDMGEVCTQAAMQRAAGAARAALGWARRRAWRSVTIASGAFPSSITDFPLRTSTPVPRWDAVLWAEVAGEPAGMPDIGYGDYAVSSPRLLPGRSPMPNLRYAGKRHWHVYRYPADPAGGMNTFHDLCRDVLSSAHWPPQGSSLSWGDEQIELRAKVRSKPGNAAMWRAFGTSHHLAVVASRLAELGEP